MARRERRKPKTIAPEAIFLQAVNFHMAFKVLEGWKAPHPSGKRAMAIPGSVISALAIELFLKTIICIETGHIPSTHNLLVLFNHLKPQTQSDVQAEWDHYAKVHEHRWADFDALLGQPVARDLQTALKVGSRTFELARYYYEESAEFQFYLGALPEMLKRVIFKLRPDFAARAKVAAESLYGGDGHEKTGQGEGLATNPLRFSAVKSMR